MDNLVDFLASAAVVASTVIAGVAWLGRKVERSFRKVEFSFRDFQGTPEHDGVAAVPGVMEQLRDLKKEVAGINKRLDVGKS